MHSLDKSNIALKYTLALIFSIICGLFVIRIAFLFNSDEIFTFKALINSKATFLCASSIFISFLTTGFLYARASIYKDRYDDEHTVAQVYKHKDAVKTKFLAFAAHNLRTPATAFRWSLNGFLKSEFGDLTKDQKQSLHDLYSISLTMLGVIEDFLDISKLQLHQLEITLRAVPLVQLKDEVGRILKQLAPLTKEKNITVETLFAIEENAIVHIDIARIARVVENLIENAVNYTLENGQIKIELKNDNKSIIFSITDNGIGIPDQDKDKIFTEFFRSLNAKKHKSTGSGIGLFLVKKLIEAHEGKIHFVSKEGSGSTFTFTIPKVSAQEEQVEEVFKRI